MEDINSHNKILVGDPISSIAYRQIPGKSPGLIFFHGYGSDMNGAKAQRLLSHCQATGRAYLAFDGYGHGASDGELSQGTIGRWFQDAVEIINKLVTEPQILVGSSMGAWISLLVARALPDKVKGLVTLAAAPDFSEDLLWDHFTPLMKQTLTEIGQVYFGDCDHNEAGWLVTDRFIQDGRAHLLLKDQIAITCPVRLLHGQQDPDVPWQTSLRLAEKLASPDVEVTLLKDGDHRLSRPQDLDLLVSIVDRLVTRLERGII